MRRAARADVVIAGGGPAGLSTALHLRAADPALTVVVLEPRAYPRDKICAGAVAARALDALDRVGVRLPLGTTELPAVRIDAFEVAIAGGCVRVAEPAGAQVVRRIAFDAALAGAARERGVVVKEGLRLHGLVRRSDGLTVHCANEHDEPSSIEARVLVGADGVGGTTRRLAGFPRASLRAQAVEVDTPTVAGDAPLDTLRFTFLPELRGYLWDFPTPLDGGVMMSRGAYLLRDRREEHGVREHLARHLATRGLSLDDFRPRQLAEQGLAPHAPLATPRVLLVGEAAGIDFPTGEGIAQAILYGAIAGPYLAHALADDRLGFTDWARAWLGSDEGRFLRRRALGGRVLFGEGRDRVGRALSRSPRAFELALRRFAGRRPSRGTALAALGQLAIGFVNGGTA